MLYYYIYFGLQEACRLNKDVADLKSRLSAKDNDNLRMEALLDKLQEEKKRMTQRLNKLTVNGKTQIYLFQFNRHF